MHIQLIHGQFSAQDAIDIITHMIQIKVKYHESKITSNSTIEDIKMREAKIKRLQKDLSEVRNYIEQEDTIMVHSEITLSNNNGKKA